MSHVNYDHRAQEQRERLARLRNLRDLAQQSPARPDLRNIVRDASIVFACVAFACACFVYMMPAQF